MKVNSLLSAVIGISLLCGVRATVAQCCDVETNRDIICQNNPDNYQKYAMVGRVLEVDEEAKTLVVKVMNAYKGTTGKGTKMSIQYGSTGPTQRYCDRSISQSSVRKAYIMSGATHVSSGESYTEGCDLFRLWDEIDTQERTEWTQFARNKDVACGRKCTKNCLKYVDTCKECDCGANGELLNCVGECYNTANDIRPECVCHARRPPSSCDLECKKWAKDSNGCTLCRCDEDDIIDTQDSPCATFICEKGDVCTLDENNQPSCDEDDGMINLSPVGSTCDTFICSTDLECEMENGTPTCSRSGDSVEQLARAEIVPSVTCDDLVCDEHAADARYRSACVENDGVPECVYSKFDTAEAVPSPSCDDVVCDEHAGDDSYRSACIENNGVPECVYSKFGGAEDTPQSVCDGVVCDEHAGDESYRSSCIEKNGVAECVYSKFGSAKDTPQSVCDGVVCDEHAGDDSYRSSCIEKNGVVECVYSKFGSAKDIPQSVCDGVVCDEHAGDDSYRSSCIEKKGLAECVYSKFGTTAGTSTCDDLVCNEHEGDASFRSACIANNGMPECVYSRFGVTTPVTHNACESVACNAHEGDTSYRSTCVEESGQAKCVYSKFAAANPPTAATCDTYECNAHAGDPSYRTACIEESGAPKCIYSKFGHVGPDDTTTKPVLQKPSAETLMKPKLTQSDVVSMLHTDSCGQQECAFGSHCVDEVCVKVCATKECPTGQVCALDMSTGAPRCTTDLCAEQDVCIAHEDDASYRSGCVLQDGVPKCVYSKFG
ncbi:hypothetical protein SARC_06515 [Sphaeroforma arctica JP610]|uniref:Follistatin-like domain-containing protein n=1 Tax=Sphaeroforma arctica JP610 TaxID=667725 RepID=A0A0L0FYX1_9EUKA|nr:hypothetical protein SARC_06515 [Sphaeroforma arctica JP610]KNC81148.1 hypothetical protein SARC_06515 [Sphaeroforma arctica JP610]|eukprot:XP_014155050.1 hypothetical protein SARC_06515 [Sphaeroforma arctica JP610]